MTEPDPLPDARHPIPPVLAVLMLIVGLLLLAPSLCFLSMSITHGGVLVSLGFATVLVGSLALVIAALTSVFTPPQAAAQDDFPSNPTSSAQERGEAKVSIPMLVVGALLLIPGLLLFVMALLLGIGGWIFLGLLCVVAVFVLGGVAVIARARRP